jgi:hypothetical protein
MSRMRRSARFRRRCSRCRHVVRVKLRTGDARSGPAGVGPASMNDAKARRAHPPGAAWVVLPTYDEAPNLAAIVDAVRGGGAGAPPAHSVHLVDDDTPDRTGAK